MLNKILTKDKEEDYDYPPDRYPFIINLMMKFELCYEIDRDVVLIPDLLEFQEPEIDFDYENSLKFIIDYDYLPKSVMPRFIVRMHNDIKAKNLQWRTGVVLEVYHGEQNADGNDRWDLLAGPQADPNGNHREQV